MLLIFDEIVTGVRLAYGGAQERYDVTPDICTLGKIIGSDKWLMQLGALSGNPIAAAAGVKTMEISRRNGSYDRLRTIGKTL